MSQKVIVSKPGYDAVTETNPDNLIFSSDYNTLKYYTSGSINVSVNQAAGSLGTFYTNIGTVAHNLGYKPFFITYAIGPDIDYAPTGIFYITLSGDYSVELDAAVDNNNLYVIASGFAGFGTANYTATFQYKLFKNNLGL